MAERAFFLMVLVDTSVWIDFFTGRRAAHVKKLEIMIADGEDICICGVVLTEILQGIRMDREYRKIKEHLDALIYLPVSRQTFITAADMYRKMRKKGITIRRPVDCIIGACAVEHDAGLLHNDRDFKHMEKHCGLGVAG